MFTVLIPPLRTYLGGWENFTPDEGRTWDTNNFLMLAWSSWTNLGGHPRSILMPDGTIVTGYYAHYFKDHQGVNENHDVVSHCLRWSPPADWPPVA